MIIPRKYEWLGVLYQNDPASKALIDEAFTKADKMAFSKEYLLEYNHCNISAFMNLGCGIPGECYGHFMKGFEELDRKQPYDNGLTFNDVSEIEFETSRKGTAIQMRLVLRDYDNRYRIVGFAALENKDGKPALNKGWEMTAPFTIG